MSSGLQHKMHNFEVTPPAGVWEKIATALDESASGHQFPSGLYNLEITPPVTAWQNLAASLDESAMVDDYGTKLRAIAVTPPASAWRSIANALGTGQASDFHERRRLSSFLKYAAAAVLIGLLAWGGFQFLGINGGKKVVASQEDSFSAKDSGITFSPKVLLSTEENIGTAELAASLDEARNDAALEQSKKTYAKLDVTATHSKIKNAADFFFIPDNYEPTGTRSIDFGYPEVAPQVDIANRYIIMMTPDGNIIRVSKKLSDLVCCVSGEEQDKDCIDQMKKWREKIANPSINHSSGNVMDILNLVNSLQEL